jgi:predicted alpha/beta hydrolase family esterase
MTKTLKLMCVHGLGDHRTSPWQAQWEAAVRQGFGDADVQLVFEFVTYDDIFVDYRPEPFELVRAVFKLGWSGIAGPRTKAFGLEDIPDKIRFSAGYVVAWTENDNFQKRARKRILDAVREHKPDVVLAHSLGSLITYNAFSHAEAQADADLKAALARVRYVTLGSQIGNRFVMRNLTNGRIQPLPVKFWHHLYNRNDDVFTAPIRLPEATNFRQTATPFDDPDLMDHAAESYFTYWTTAQDVWRPMAAPGEDARAFGAAGMAKALASPQVRQPRRKALLVGINDYPEAAQRLEGCVNDVFTMSAVLQESGFAPETIRTCLDDRATADGILERLHWLLDDAHAGDELVFYYSGHGARVPQYGPDLEPDHYVETLVPWDFDWTPERWISDDQIYCLYSQLPYDTRLAMIFDCCHSGGIHRDGAARARGITPPDDIRHRELKWDARTQMWVQRDFVRLNEGFTSDARDAVRFFGREGATERLGRAGMLRGLSQRQYAALKRNDPEAARGPYLPLIIEACGEAELSYEYRHGAASHGAFTFSLASILRREAGLSFKALVEKTRDQLADLRYDQTPQILGPTAVMEAKIPWLG